MVPAPSCEMQCEVHELFKLRKCYTLLDRSADVTRNMVLPLAHAKKDRFIDTWVYNRVGAYQHQARSLKADSFLWNLVL